MGDARDLTSESVEHVSIGEKLVDLGGDRSVEFAQDDRRVTEQFGQFRSGVRTYGAELGDRECWQVQGKPD